MCACAGHDDRRDEMRGASHFPSNSQRTKWRPMSSKGLIPRPVLYCNIHTPSLKSHVSVKRASKHPSQGCTYIPVADEAKRMHTAALISTLQGCRRAPALVLRMLLLPLLTGKRRVLGAL